ncbi:MAG TPA: hypothetical protein VGQ35_02580 [Dongiaceae bacterium]|jgi:hypothetical protein|nr:hypothetical protein [Dongiaceae bacterium]
MMMCDLQLLPCQEVPARTTMTRAEAAKLDAAQLQRRAAERTLADVRRAELRAEATISHAAGKAVKRLALLEVGAALDRLQTMKTEIAARLLLLAHAGRARAAYAQAHGGRK